MSLIELNKVKIEIVDSESTRTLVFDGVIDEDFTYSQLKCDSSKFVVDFDNLNGINSCGIREWINFVESLGDSVEIEYNNCPQIVIQQMNMVSGFLTKNAKVIDFYAPYFCEETDEEKMILINASEVINGKAPEKTLEMNGDSVELEFDAIEEQYFKFLNM